MPRIRVPRPFAAIAFAAAVACTSTPTALCGCSVPGPYALVYGRVTDPAGTPVAGGTVHWQMGTAGTAGCAAIAGSQGVPVDESGVYHVGVFPVGEGPEQCVRLAALPPAGSPLRGSDTVQIAIPTPRTVPSDSVRRDLVLRAP
jgi:hypothetical protein